MKKMKEEEAITEMETTTPIDIGRNKSCVEWLYGQIKETERNNTRHPQGGQEHTESLA